VNRASTLKSSLLLLLVACLLFGVTACTKQDTSLTEKKLDMIDRRLADISDSLGKLEERLDKMDAERLAAKGSMLTLKDRLANIEKKLAEVSSASLSVAGGLVDSSPTKPGENGSKLAAGSRDLITDIKEAVKKELKKDEEAKRIERRKKQAEQNKKWVRNEFDGQIKGFPEFAEKIGLNGSQETEIRQIAEEAFEKVMRILSDAWEKPEDEVDWGEAMKEIEEIYKDAEAQIEPYVTEEQGKQLREYFGR